MAGSQVSVNRRDNIRLVCMYEESFSEMLTSSIFTSGFDHKNDRIGSAEKIKFLCPQRSNFQVVR